MPALILDAAKASDAVDDTIADRADPAASRQVHTAPLVRLQSVSKRFATATGDIRALDDVSLDIQANEFFTLLGPSGCGKTTLLRLIAGFEHPDSGHLQLDGKDVLADPPNKRPVNIVFQSYALFPHMSVAKNVAFGLERLGQPRATVAARVADMLKLVKMDAMADRKPAQLSGGQQQRVALARALAPNPKLLLLDEPLSALDYKLRRGMQLELKRLQRETGITFLLVTHDQEEALSMSDRITVLNEGRIEQIGTPTTLYDAPKSRFVAEFFGANVLAGRIAGSGAPVVAIRPERVLLVKDGDGRPGRVTERTYLGATTALTVVLDDDTPVKVESHDGSAWPLAARVVCRFPADALKALDA